MLSSSFISGGISQSTQKKTPSPLKGTKPSPRYHPYSGSNTLPTLITHTDICCSCNGEHPLGLTHDCSASLLRDDFQEYSPTGFQRPPALCRESYFLLFLFLEFFYLLEIILLSILFVNLFMKWKKQMLLPRIPSAGTNGSLPKSPVYKRKLPHPYLLTENVLG